jgi:alpha-tubulin suppressor-like RCC1 family protein
MRNAMKRAGVLTAAASLLAAIVLSLAAAGSAWASETVAGWGSTSATDSLGDGSVLSSDVPEAIGGLSGVKQVSAGFSGGLALLNGGTVMAWGANEDGFLGDGSLSGPETCLPPEGAEGPCSRTPVAIPGLSGVVEVSAGEYVDLALLGDGKVMQWGVEPFGGNGAPGEASSPQEVPGLSGVKAISAGWGFGVALLSDGTVASWGVNSLGQLGDGTFTGPSKCHPPTGGSYGCSSAPVEVNGLHDVTAISAGPDEAAAVSGGRVYTWGFNQEGQDGNGVQGGPQNCASGSFNEWCTTTPVEVSGLANVTAVAVGAGTTLALLEDGRVMSWGLSERGGLGNGSDTGPDECERELNETHDQCSTTPVEVTGLKGVRAIASGFSQLALLSDGTVMSWGDNALLGLGDGAKGGPGKCVLLEKPPVEDPCSTAPVAVSQLSAVSAISTGGDALAIGTVASHTIASAGSTPGQIDVVPPPSVSVNALTATSVSPSDPPPNGAVAVIGALSYEIAPVPLGGSEEVTLELPPGSDATEVFKLNGSGEYEDVTSLVTSPLPSDNVTLRLTDGGAGDADAIANGVIVDPVVAVRAAQIGRCAKVPGVKEHKKTVYHGAFTNNGCTATSTSRTGKYEWTAGPSRRAFTGSGGTVKLVGSGGAKITCAGSSSSGEYASETEMVATLTLTGCANAAHASCQSSGQASGAIVSNELSGALGYIDEASGQAGVELSAKTAGALASFECGAEPVLLAGSLVGAISADKMTAKPALKFAASQGHQVPLALEGHAPGALTLTRGANQAEAVTLAGKASIANQESLEVKAL